MLINPLSVCLTSTANLQKVWKAFCWTVFFLFSSLVVVSYFCIFWTQLNCNFNCMVYRKISSEKNCLYSVIDCLSIQDGILTLWIKISITMNLSSKAVLLPMWYYIKGFSKFNRKLNPFVQKYVCIWNTKASK